MLVQLPPGLDAFAWARRLGDMEEDLQVLLGMPVDVIDESSLKGCARDRILSEAVAL